MAIWTHSRLETAEACPLNYRWSYLERRSGYSIASGAGRIGNAVHETLEAAIKDPGINVAKQLLRAIMANNLTMKEELQASTFQTKIAKFVERFHVWRVKHGVPEDQCWVERRLAVDKDFQTVDYTDRERAFFRGVIDLAALVPRKESGPILMLWDHKTGEPGEIELRAPQFHGYSILGLAAHLDISEVRCAIHYVKTGQIVWFPHSFLPETITAELRQGLLARIQRAEEIAADDDPQPKDCWKCMFCQYQPVCPLKGGAAP